MIKHKKLGEILLAEGIITPQQLKEAIVLQGEEGGRLGDILIKVQRNWAVTLVSRL